jgi:hypothetical protein
MIKPSSTEVTAKLNQVTEIIKKYYPGASLSCDAWELMGDFSPDLSLSRIVFRGRGYLSGFEIGGIEVEEGYVGCLTAEFSQNFYKMDFDKDSSPFELGGVEFVGRRGDHYVAYVAAGGGRHDGWLGACLSPSHVPEMCKEIFAVLKDLKICKQ